jgi:hypothetical protein
MFGFATGALAADSLYQWNFDSSDGANTGTASGGALALNVGVVTGSNGYAAGAFTGAGVSGDAGDKAFAAANAYDNYYENNNYSPISNAAGVGNIDLSGVTQFTITLWIKRDGGRNVDLLNIGNTTTPGNASNPGISIGLDGTWGNGVRVGVNGYTSYTGDLWSAGTDNDWVFMAFAYDGTSNNLYYNPTMSGLYGGAANAAIITGEVGTAAAVGSNPIIHTGDYVTAVGSPSVTSTGTVFLANDGSNTLGTTNGFNGGLDDIRIYSGLLTVPEIESIRLEAIASPIPEPASTALLLGGFGLLAVMGRRSARRR